MKELGSLVPFLLIALVFWLLLIRPQRKRALEVDRVQRSLTVGDEVMLSSGFAATVAELPDEGEFLRVELSPGVHVRVARGAVARVIASAEPPRDTDIEPPRDTDTEPPTDLTKH